MLWDETVVDRGGVGPRDLDLDGDGRAGGGRTLSDRFLGGPGDHLVRTVGTVRVRPSRVPPGQVEDRPEVSTYWKCDLNEIMPRTR